jgi:phage terminase large subunit-like protein
MPRGLSTANKVIEFIEEECRIPEGPDVGRPVKLRPWQKDILRQIYDNPHGTERAIISFGRKNAKTTLAAFILLAHLVGPCSRRNAQLYSTAQSQDQAAIVFGAAVKIIRMNPVYRSSSKLDSTLRNYTALALCVARTRPPRLSPVRQLRILRFQ